MPPNPGLVRTQAQREGSYAYIIHLPYAVTMKLCYGEEIGAPNKSLVYVRDNANPRARNTQPARFAFSRLRSSLCEYCFVFVQGKHAAMNVSKQAEVLPAPPVLWRPYWKEVALAPFTGGETKKEEKHSMLQAEEDVLLIDVIEPEASDCVL